MNSSHPPFLPPASGEEQNHVPQTPLLLDAMLSEPALEAVHIRKDFPLQRIKLGGPARAVHAVEDVSLALYPGRATALVGESGSGKTTVARLLAGVYQPTAGTLRYQGEAVSIKGQAALKAYRHKVQLVFQDPFASLNPVHTIAYHLARPLHIHGHVHNVREEQQAIRSLLERVSLTPAEQYMPKFPHQLSGGQRQRVAIARALAVQPSVLLADEPVSMLDVSIRLGVLNLLLRLKEEEQLAILFITHDIASARYFAEETLVMYAGQLVEGGPSNEVIQHPKHPYTQLLLSAAPDPDKMSQKSSPSGAHQVGAELAPAREGLSTPEKSSAHEYIAPPIKGEPPSLINPPSGCRFRTRCPHAMPQCSEAFPARSTVGKGHWAHCYLYGG
jgi:peptide/nickel transport system ATP-binding protein